LFENPAESSENESLQENTGVEMCGSSLESYVATMVTIDEKSFKNQIIIVEVATRDFIFKFKSSDGYLKGMCECCKT
jgi:hypothetical protein